MPTVLEHLLSEDQTAAELDQAKPTLQTWRCLRRGPPWVKIGRKIYYPRDGILRWLKSREIDPAERPRGRPRQASA